MAYIRRRENSGGGEEAKEPFHLEFVPPPTCERFMASQAFIRGIRGPVGSGKSSTCCLEIIRKAGEMPPGPGNVRRSKWLVLRNTYRELMDTTIATWLQWFPEEHFGPLLRQDMVHPIRIPGDRAAKVPAVSLEVLFRAADRPEDVAKFKSLDITGAWGNEAGEISKEIIDLVETRIGRYPRRKDLQGKFWHGMILDTNPPDTDSWWHFLAEEVVPILMEVTKREWDTDEQILRYWRGRFFARAKEDRRFEGMVASLEDMLGKAQGDMQAAEASVKMLLNKYAFFAQPSGLSAEAENLENLPEGYYRRQVIGKTREWINVFVHGNYGIVMKGKPVYPEYNDGVHFDAELTEPFDGFKILCGWDFGRTPSVCLSQVDAQGRWGVFDELCGEDIGIDEFGDLFTKHCAENYPGFSFVHYVDPSGFFKGDKDDRTCAQILEAKGIEVEGSIQDPELRMNAVKRALRGGYIGGIIEFRIGPKCRKLRKALMGGYTFERVQVSGDRYKEKPDKGPYSHIANALEYVATQLYRDDLFDSASRRTRGEEEEEVSGFVGGFTSSNTGASEITGY